MKDEEINLIIAEFHLTREGMGGDWDKKPDYCNDLNAVFEAEKSMPESWRQAYADEILYHCTTTGEWDYDPMDQWRAIHTTARQRAECLANSIISSNP